MKNIPFKITSSFRRIKKFNQLESHPNLSSNDHLWLRAMYVRFPPESPFSKSSPNTTNKHIQCIHSQWVTSFLQMNSMWFILVYQSCWFFCGKCSRNSLEQRFHDIAGQIALWQRLTGTRLISTSNLSYKASYFKRALLYHHVSMSEAPRFFSKMSFA